MDIVLVLLRLLHIVSAVAWIGIALSFTFFIVPAALASGDSGARFLKTFLTKTPILVVFPIAAGLTMGAGLLLYPLSTPWTHLSGTGSMVLSIGATFGIIAGIHLRFATGSTGEKLIDVLDKRVTDDQKLIEPEVMTEIRTLGTKLVSNSRINFVLMVIALLGMGGARYL